MKEHGVVPDVIDTVSPSIMEGLPFIQLSYDENIQSIIQKMLYSWKLSIPRVCLVVVSNISPLTGWKNSKQLDNFIAGLVKAANTTDMWILTHGINVGIAKLIGEAFHDELVRRQPLTCHRHITHGRVYPQLTLIGICQKELLTNANKFCEEGENINLENEGNCPDAQKYEVNPYHSHFFVVENNTCHKIGVNEFLMKFETYLRGIGESSLNEANETDISLHAESDNIDSVISDVPVIAVLIQGGIACMNLILVHLQKKFPVIVIKGSGGLANLLAYAYYEITKSPNRIKDAEYIENILKPSLCVKITQTFPNLLDNKLSRNSFCMKIFECIKLAQQDEVHYLTVLNVQDQSCDLKDIPVHLLKALFNSQKTAAQTWEVQMKKNLYLTMDWNCPDVALTEVFQTESSKKIEIDKYIFETALLTPGREIFVSIFLEQGFQIHGFLNATQMCSLLKKSMRQDFFRSVCWEGILGYSEIFEVTDLDFNWIVEELTSIPNFISSNELDYSVRQQHNDYIASMERKATSILVVWAILSYRIALAKLLWRNSDQPIYLALISYMILKNLCPFVRDSNQKKEIKIHYKDFAEMASGVLDACYNDLPCRAYDSLKQIHPEWTCATALDIAAASKNKLFLSHICCQKYLNNLLMGNIKVRDLTWGVFTIPVWVKILLSAFLIFPMYVWIRFKVSAHGEVIKDFDDYEINENEVTEKKAVKNKRNLNNGSLLNEKSDDMDLSSLKAKFSFPPLWLMILWVWSAPITKFWICQTFYMLFLALFSLAVLWPSCGNKFVDTLVCVWLSVMTMDGIYCNYHLYKKCASFPFFFKWVEIIYRILFIALYVSGRILGMGMFSDPYNGKILVCSGLLYMYYRTVFIFFPISSTLGPLLYRVKRMVLLDFMNFLRMALLVMISNGIILQAMLYPDYPITAELFRLTFHRTMISLFLTPTTDFDEDKTSYCAKWIRKPLNATFCKVGMYVDYTCPNPNIWPYIFGMQYLTLLKLILLTLLYALFSNTHELFEAKSDSIWKYQRYLLICDFSTRPRLPAPLSILSYSAMLLRTCYRFCCSFTIRTKKKVKFTQIKRGKLSCDFGYWRHLAEDYNLNVSENIYEKGNIQKQVNILSGITEDIYYQHKMIHKLKSQISELGISTSYIQSFLETIKYRTAKEEDMQDDVTIHLLSRRSPYPKTQIQRFPVPEKYVPWDVVWRKYIPPAFSLSVEKFPPATKSYVDHDVIADKKNIPVFQWNMAIDKEEFYENRQSWITDPYGDPVIYKLDMERLPQNPMGRTGLRGKGGLAMWGPNHFIYVIITRKGIFPSVGPNDQLQLLVETVQPQRNLLSLPGGFIKSEIPYVCVQSAFKNSSNGAEWKSSEDMINFFRSCVKSTQTEENETEVLLDESFQCKFVLRGYMDDTLNTDHAWKEVELWHVHYNIADNLENEIKVSIGWCPIAEDVYENLPPGQTVLVQNVIKSMKFNGD